MEQSINPLIQLHAPAQDGPPHQAQGKPTFVEQDLEQDEHEERHDPHATVPITNATRIINLTAVILPFVGLVTAVIFMWGWGFSWLYLTLFATMFIISGCGITVGFHRYFTHKSFETYRPVQVLMAVFGSMAMEGPVLKWVAQHRRHHQHSDKDFDPHSPHHHGDTVGGVLRGFWHAHVGWLFQPDMQNFSRYVKDLLQDRMVRRVSQYFIVWVIIGALIPTLIAGLVTMSWQGAVLGFLWGGLARIFFVHHVTWSINSVCHIWGAQPFRSHDHSRNNVVFGFLGFGEGWHNNHHAFPTSAKHGLFWWQLDLSYVIIRTLAIFGLVWQIRVPKTEAMRAKMNPQPAHA